MKGEVINFEILRIQSELEKYQKTESLPHIILDGVYSLDEIFDLYYDQLSDKHKKIADDLKINYTQTVERCITSLRLSLKKEYSYTMKNLSTEHESFRFTLVLNKYRHGINPVRALYYEFREVSRRFTSTNEYHVWLIDTLTDYNFKNILLDALLKDIQRLEKIIKRFYIPIVKNSNSVPLELFHAKQTVSDFRHYYDTFANIDVTKFE